MRAIRRLGIALLALVPLSAAPATQPTDCSAGTGCPGSTCLTSVTSAAAKVPLAACPQHGELQGATDVFSWNEFIAFNWPASQDCTANTAKSILNVKSGADGPVVWQTQMDSDEVFVAPNLMPVRWCNGKALTSLFNHAPVPMRHTAKAVAAAHLLGGPFAKIAEPTGVEAVGGVVTDQQGRWLRYERYMNRTEYETVVPKGWFRLKVLNSLPSITLPNGSIELKAAWKILTPAEIAKGRYYTTVATVYNTPGGGTSPGKNPVTLGLVGLHIIHKTPQQESFFWSTFEQVDNDNVFGNTTGLPPNVQTAKKPYVELNPNGTPHNGSVNIQRVHKAPINPTLNTYYQGLLGNSVFRYYRLNS